MSIHTFKAYSDFRKSHPAAEADVFGLSWTHELLKGAALGAVGGFTYGVYTSYFLPRVDGGLLGQGLRCAPIGAGMYGMFRLTQAVSAQTREKDDIWNGAVAGMGAGIVASLRAPSFATVAYRMGLWATVGTLYQAYYADHAYRAERAVLTPEHKVYQPVEGTPAHDPFAQRWQAMLARKEAI
ncbi:hypothetical protein CXG81DRAFT_25956 [Caulochytrium protostelioides]|uniref:NADH-ubiquinone oxidoreductase subunit B14.7 n=1 Tax=Caulochytrium protostelioides TaxID=1555241 RepID=A0A4P9X8P9_9FUNG|nr:hypothetical protein CXG81DRAFT_25956 [Caulochytrium protostelioides]|eukprot:RKP01351.1 hypothetical protein CXG81DRAFT_25956 [Caulochytrium protostelioides]